MFTTHPSIHFDTQLARHYARSSTVTSTYRLAAPPSERARFRRRQRAA